MKWRAWLANQWKKLWTGDESPTAVAFGFAVGTFFGFSPLFGLKTVLTFAVARLCRGSAMAALVAIALHDVGLPLMPFILRSEYDIGWWLLSHPHRFPATLHGPHQGHWVWTHWSTYRAMGGPLVLGWLCLGVPLGMLTFFVMRSVLERSTGSATPPR